MTVDRYLPIDASVEDVEALAMTEEEFRLFYDRTARPLWAYLARTSGDRRVADDLLQEAYYRLLKSAVPIADEAHRKNYLFRIATNLVVDLRRHPQADAAAVSEPSDEVATPAPRDTVTDAVRRVDVGRALAKLRPRDRAMIWLAYVNGSSHREIADALGLKTTSIKLLLFRARRKLAALLQEVPR
jgi:RNA polymerase sigma-70 factor (ECF subfamily)